MASCTIQKHSITETAAQIEHNNIDRDGKNGKKHKNKDINPELSKYNVYVDKRSKMEILDDIKNDVASFDAACPPKKKQKINERVVTLEIEYTTPRELAPVLPYKPTKEEEDALIEKYVLSDMDRITSFLKDGEPAIKEKYGKTYGTTIHYDECHYYYDKADKMYHMSRPHLHTFVTAQAEIMEKTGEKDDKGKDIYTGTGQYRINGKDALKRSTYKEVNHLLDAPSQKYYGCTYEDGTKRKSRGSVEDMKRNSIRAEQEAHERLINENEAIKTFIKENTEMLSVQDALLEDNAKTLAEQEKKKAEYETFISVDHDYTDYKPVPLKKGYRAVPERDIAMYTAATDDVPKLKKEIESKDTAYTDLYKKYQKVNGAVFTAQKERDKYKGYKEEKEKMMADFQKRLNKVKKNPFKDPSDMSHLIHEYVLLKVSNEKEKAAILKACEALDKLDAYQWRTVGYTTYFDGSFDKEYSRLQSKLKEEYMKILDYGGRAEMYDDISTLWTDSKAVSKRVWMNTKSSNAAFSKSVQSVHSQYQPLITGILSELFELIRVAFELTREVSHGYDR